jgi:hypothetical protein
MPEWGSIMTRIPVYTQDQLDKQAREQGRVRVVPVGMRDVGHIRDGAIPTSWFYTDRIVEFSENWERVCDNKRKYKERLKMQMED